MFLRMRRASAIRTWLWLFGCGALLAPSGAAADLILDVSGMPGSGETTWVFSGSSVTTGGWFLGASTSQPFTPSADATSTTVNEFFAAGSITITFDTDTRNITQVGLQDFGSDDRFILGIDGSSGTSPTGVASSWAGSIVLGVDIGSLHPGAYLDRSLNLGTVDLTITSVPEPGTAGLVALGTLGLALRRTSQRGRRASP